MSLRPVIGALVTVLSLVAGGRAVLLAQAGPPVGRDVLTVSADGRVSGDNNHAGGSGGGAASSTGQLTVNYLPVVTPVQVQVGASTGIRYDGAAGEMSLVGGNVGASAALPMGKRTNVVATGSVGYVPSYSLVANRAIPTETVLENPGLLPSQSIDFQTVKRSAHTSASSVSVSRGLTSRSSVSASYGLNQSLFVNATDPSVRSRSVQGRFQQQITKHLGFHAGYGRRIADYSSSPVNPSGDRSKVTPAAVEDLDIGLDYSEGRAFAISRNASLNFTTGSSFAKSAGAPRRLFVTGNATFAYTLGKKGRASVDYRRAVQIVPGFGQPVFSDAVTFTATERIGRSLQLSANVAYSLGSVGAPSAGAAHRYESLTGSARAGYMVGGSLSLYVQYLQYSHGLGAAVEVLRTVPREQTRHSVVGGFAYSLPLIREERPRGPRGRR